MKPDTTLSSPADLALAPARRSRARFAILALLAIGTVINYLDRTVLGIAAPSLTKELGLSAGVMGIVFSAFSWTYTLSQIPAGLLLDRIGAKKTYFLAVSGWSAFIILNGLSGGLISLMIYRLGLGVAESPCFSANSRVVGHWFPQRERARATSIYQVGQYIGLAVFSPLLFWIIESFGWRAMFVIVGAVGLAFSVVWWLRYHEPHESRTMNDAEREYIGAGGGLSTATDAQRPFSWHDVGRLLRRREIWGAAIGQFAGNSTVVFFLTWFPTYLVTERHMAWLKIGFFAILPFLGASAGVLFGGWVSDLLLRRTGNVNLSRKLPIITGLLLSACIVVALYVQSDTAVIAVLSLAFFGQGMGGLGWSIIPDIAPKRLMGLTGGIFNFTANIAGIVTPIVIGAIVSLTGSFYWGLMFIGAVAILGAASYIFILGDIKRIELPDDTAPLKRAA
ncbi:MFS transporter [Burkholderia sp. Ax-1724]|uniref:MFS transporter n=2 Tax=Burkholderiaceae TaxID=119060 RepID=UPI00141FE4FF|nr:MFS transporter [Burkholderia sp. Ax-1724]NIF54794.1 MFS transporter [Burkholderia sp. Ax-1724]